MKKALFPISVDSDHFTTETVADGLTQVLPMVNSIMFLVADSLQIYNKSKQILIGKNLSEIVNTFRERNRYFQERVLWLNKIKKQLGVDEKKISFDYIRADDICDKNFYRIFKLLQIVYHTDELFKIDIQEAALNHLKKNNTEISEIELSLNILYILEEIGLNIRLRLWNKLELEFYIGEFHLPLIKLYHGCYSLKLKDVCNKNDKLNYTFYSGNVIDKRVRWKEVISH